MDDEFNLGELRIVPIVAEILKLIHSGAHESEVVSKTKELKSRFDRCAALIKRLDESTLSESEQRKLIEEEQMKIKHLEYQNLSCVSNSAAS